MSKRRKKLSLKPKRKPVDLVNTEKAANSELTISQQQFRKNSILLKLAAKPEFVGAMQWMLAGCFAVGSILGILFAIPDLGRLFENITYQIVSIVPKMFIPPETYIPGVLTPPFFLLVIAGFTAYGYKKGGTPPKIEIEKDTRSLIGKLFEFLFFFALIFFVVYYRFRSDYPKLNFVQIISDPFFILALVIITLGIIYYVFSRHQSTQFLIFIMSSAAAVGFVLFLLGLIIFTLFKSCQYALSQ